jgi:Pvc16 N-terminal domain
MSNVLAIAAVTETIVQILSDALDAAGVPGAQVSALPPDSPHGLPEHGVNVYLYQVAPNPSLRNADLPTRRADGTLLRRPQAALDLSYLISFYGDETQLEQQRLLGAVTRALHAQPVLPRSTIEYVQSNVSFLAGADLASQRELVRVTPINFTLEELSKLWSFLLKIDYVLSVAYQASVVLIGTDDPVPPPALPVLSTNITALPFSQPVIASIVPAAGSGPLILPGSQIVLHGRNFVLTQSTDSGLITATTLVLIGGTAEVPLSVTSTDITLALPPGLPAGTVAAQVTQSLLLGTPPLPHQQGFQSDVMPFVLHPAIQQSSPGVYEIAVHAGALSPPGDSVTVTVTPTVQPGQRALLELLQATAPMAANLFDGGTIATVTNTLSFDIGTLPPGKYLVRIRIDGAESPFQLDAQGVPVAPVTTL